MDTIAKNKKGIALLWTLIICFVMLLVAGTMVGYITKDSQSSVRIEDSVQAYAAAKSGMDWGRYRIDKATDTIPKTTFPDFLINNAEVTVTIEYDVTTGRGAIDSIGEITLSGVKRKLHYNITPVASNRVTPSSGLNFLPALCGNSNFQYDFWIGNLGNPFTFGVRGSNGGLYMSVADSGIVRLKTDSRTSVDFIDLAKDAHDTSYDPSTPYGYRAEIKYIKNMSATLEISKNSMDVNKNQKFEPVGSVAINLIGIDLGTIQSLYIPSYPYTYIGSNGPQGDGEYLNINSSNYVDNIYVSGSACQTSTPPPALTPLIITTNISQGVTIRGNNSYRPGETASASVEVKPNYSFNGWGGDCSFGGFAPEINIPIGNVSINCTAYVTYNPTCTPSITQSAVLNSPADGVTVVPGVTALSATATYTDANNCGGHTIYAQMIYVLSGSGIWNYGPVSSGSSSVTANVNASLVVGNYWWTVQYSVDDPAMTSPDYVPMRLLYVATACTPSISQSIVLNSPADGATVTPGVTTLSATATYTDANNCAGHTISMQVRYNPAGTGTWYESVISYPRSSPQTINFTPDIPAGNYWWYARYSIDGQPMNNDHMTLQRLLHVASVCVPSISQSIVLNSPADGATVAPGVTALTATATYTDVNNCAGHTIYMQILYNPSGSVNWYSSPTYSGSSPQTNSFNVNLTAGDYWWVARYKVDNSDMTSGFTQTPGVRLLRVVAACVPSISQSIVLNSPADGATVTPGVTTLSATATYTDANNCAGHTISMQVRYNPAGTGTWYESVISYPRSSPQTINFTPDIPAGNYWWYARYSIDGQPMNNDHMTLQRLLHVVAVCVPSITQSMVLNSPADITTVAPGNTNLSATATYTDANHCAGHTIYMQILYNPSGSGTWYASTVISGSSPMGAGFGVNFPAGNYWWTARYKIDNSDMSTGTIAAPYARFLMVRVPQYTLTTVAGTGGTVSPGGTYNSGVTATITATPNANYQFSSWTGTAGCSGTASHTITMNENKSCTANFVYVYVCTPSITQSITQNSPASVSVVAPGVTTLTATATYTDANNCAGHTIYMQILYNPDGTGTWYASPTYSGSSPRTNSFNVNFPVGNYWWIARYKIDNSDMSSGTIATPYTWILYVRQYTLTAIAGSGGTASGSGLYNPGATATITATPNASYQFSGWTGSAGCSGTASHTITMDENKSCTANFVPAYVIYYTQYPNGYASNYDYICDNAYTGTYSYNGWVITNVDTTGSSGNWGLIGGVGSTSVRGRVNSNCDDYGEVFINSVTYRSP